MSFWNKLFGGGSAPPTFKEINVRFNKELELAKELLRKIETNQ
jgi:hypothetical protein